MEINLHIVLLGRSPETRSSERNFETNVLIDLSEDNNLSCILNRSAVIGRKLDKQGAPIHSEGKNSLSIVTPTVGGMLNEHTVSFLNYDPVTKILEGTTNARRTLCNGYVGDLIVDGWKEIQ